VRIAIFVAVLIAISIVPAFASQYQGKTIDSDSIHIEFGNDEIDFKDKIIPIIKKAEIKSNGISLPINNPEFRTMGNSFVLKSFGDDFNLITYGINVGDSFNLRTLMFAGNGMMKFNDYSGFTTQKDETVKTVIPEKESTKTQNNLHILVQNPMTIFNAKNFNYDIKSFDKSKYSGNDFQNFQGKMNGVEIVAVVKDPQGKILETQNGITKNGMYQGSVYVPENLWSKGWYSIDISAKNDLGQVEKTIEFYVMGQTASKSGSACPSGQSLVNGVCQ